MTAIAYDLPILNLIAGLDATEHVTHTRHRKTKVTLHHNGGRLSHQGVLDVWKVRPASAHFNCDAPGTVAQYVRVAEYAWATGSTIGNSDSISIEMCNATLAPDWVVGEATWRSAARLAGWLFARVIGERPNRANLVLHSYWSATDCAGPYIRRIYDQVLVAAQQSYDRIVHGIQEDVMNEAQEKLLIENTNRLRSMHTNGFNEVNGPRPMQGDLSWVGKQVGPLLTPILTQLASIQGSLTQSEVKVLSAIKQHGADNSLAIITVIREEFGDEVDVVRLADLVISGIGTDLAGALVDEMGSRLANDNSTE